MLGISAHTKINFKYTDCKSNKFDFSTPDIVLIRMHSWFDQLI